MSPNRPTPGQRATDTESAPLAGRFGSNAVAGGMEIALTILLFVLIGLGLDTWLGTRPLFMIVLFLFAAVGSFARTKLIYDAEMDRLEAERIAKRDHQRGERPVPEADAA
ncbi:MAG: hypothetical protein CL424_15650 [Acidimicrobiaceae bacterium]|nr:hypothetical protein [Acidimicrobiaceae bacterium]